MQLDVVFATFPIIFLGELPDKTMFASLVLSTRGRPFIVWVGAAAAFAVHVVIAVTVGGVELAHRHGERARGGTQTAPALPRPRGADLARHTHSAGHRFDHDVGAGLGTLGDRRAHAGQIGRHESL